MAWKLFFFLRCMPCCRGSWRWSVCQFIVQSKSQLLFLQHTPRTNRCCGFGLHQVRSVRRFFRAKILQPNAIAAVACGLEPFCLSHRLLFLGVGAMSSASSSLEFDGLAAKELANFHKAIDAYARDGSLPHNCVFTELTRRMTIIHNVSQCPHLYNGWKNLSGLMETWMDQDLWEAAARTEMKDKASLSPTTSGWMSNA